MPECSKEIIQKRVNLIIAIMAACLFAIVSKMWWLQIVNQTTYEQLAKNNRTRLIRDRAQRGRITDRNGLTLATTRPSFHVYITPEDCPETIRNDVIKRLSQLINIPYQDLLNKYNSQKKFSFLRRKLCHNVDFQTVIRIEAHHFELPGITIAAENIRFYPYNTQLCHLIGYVGEISSHQLNQVAYKDYRAGDTVGRTGVEYQFENELNGQDGFRWVEVDSIGRIGRTLTNPPPQLSHPGADIQLTIDFTLQKKVESLLESWTGAIIAMNPQNGEILAMASNPGYDPNWFAEGISSEHWQKLNANPQKPLLNRCIQIRTSPGSVFKTITAIAAMRHHSLDRSVTHLCLGSIKLYGNTFRCWNAGGHGLLNLIHAMEGSCNVFFYQEGVKTGIDEISKIAIEFGLDSLTGIRLSNEIEGIIPSRQWKKETYNQPWYPGETISVAIGQGGVSVTPIALLNCICAIANKGFLYRPKIIKSIASSRANYSDYEHPELIRKIHLHSDQWSLLHEGLRQVIAGPAGTARRLEMPDLALSGKTGTSQVISSSALRKLGYSEENKPDELKNHNWFVAFGPSDNPQIAVLIFIENGGKEGTHAKIDIAREFFIEWRTHTNLNSLSSDTMESASS